MTHDLLASQCRFMGAVRRLEIARQQYAEQPSKARAHTVIIFEAGVEMAASALKRAEAEVLEARSVRR